MATYYVSTTGNDGNPGSESQPWLTPQHAADTAVAGDTVIYENGTYNIGAGVDFDTNSGSSGNWITHQARNSRQVEWQLGSSGWAVDITVSYLVISGIKIKGLLTTASRTVSIANTDHVTIEDCEVYNTSSRGIYIVTSDDVTIDGCEIHHEIGYPAANPLDGIEVTGTSACQNLIIRDTEIYHTPHVGINLYYVDGGLIENCVIHNTQSHAIGIGDPDDVATVQDITVTGCRIYQSGNYNGETDLKRGFFINHKAQDILIERCDIYETNGPGLAIRSTATGPINVYHCTFYANHQITDGEDWGHIFLDEQAHDDDPAIRIKNCIVYHTSTGIRTYYFEFEPTTFDVDYNLLYDETGEEEIRRDSTNYGTFADYQTAGYEPHSIVSQDPLFYDQDNDVFTLTESSPAIDEGVDLGYDYEGDGPDIGAHEFGEEPEEQ